MYITRCIGNASRKTTETLDLHPPSRETNADLLDRLAAHQSGVVAVDVLEELLH